MNKVFKIIWNNVTQSFVVVSELARNRGKLSSEMKKSNVVNLFKLSIFTMCMMGGASQVQAKFVAGGIPDSNVNATSIAIADALQQLLLTQLPWAIQLKTLIKLVLCLGTGLAQKVLLPVVIM